MLLNMGKIVRIKKTNAVLFFLLFPYFNPMGLKYIPSLQGVYDGIQAWKLCSCIVIWFLYFSRAKVSKFWIECSAFQIALILTSLLNGISDSKIITNMLIASSLMMITEMCLHTCFKEFINQLWIINATLVCINFIMTALFPGGIQFATLYTNAENPLYFLGIDNGLINQLIPFVFLATIRKIVNTGERISKRNIEIIASYAVSLATLLIVKSATGIFVMLIFIILSTYYTFFMRNRIPYKLSIGIYIIFFILIVLTQSSNLFVAFISGMLGRSATFTGRSSLWRIALDKIAKRPLIGYGYTAGNIKIWGGMYSSHNMFLEIILQGGLISMLLFLLMTWTGIKRNSKATMQLSNTIFMAVFCFMLKGLMEVSIPVFYYILITMAYYGPSYNGNNIA